MGIAEKLFTLEGKIVLITGVTNGIGFSMAEALAEFKAKQIIFVHRPSTDPSKLIAALKHAAQENHHQDLVVSTIAQDLSTLKISEIEPLIFNKALELSETGKIDILINNAGINQFHSFEDYPDSEFDEVLHVNLRVPHKLTQLVGAHMIDNNIKGKIVCTCSLYSFEGGHDCSAYTVSKGGIHSLVQAANNEWASKGICVNGLVPGVIKTNMTSAIYENPQRNTKMEQRIPAGHLGVPDDFKGAIIFLVSNASNYVTGTTVTVDGGYRSW
ncbi:hypothetical protein DASC09_048540 [Saccharomycopsis crataegensis]|uniref:NAD(P)-binding protein n=1 Tax=Saccharomycopsis crataegensis TaxID=43959 RepID=A0AAV5QSR7_9ASCO|nr:hypothetical protein DASC09_048540 [Saccharomycopsis crataegensis]